MAGKSTDHREAAFFGMVAAQATHEMQNVLASIKESAGLVEDILALHPEEFPNRARLARAVESISRSVRRGAELATRLNRFAHGPDTRSMEMDVAVEAEETCFLCRRRAREKGLAVEIKPQGGPLLLEADPVLFRLVLHLCLDFCFRRLAAGSGLTVRPEAESGEVRVRFVLGPDQDGDADVAAAQASARDLGGGLDWDPAAGLLTLRVPARGV